MIYADEIRRQAEAAPCAALPAVTAALWRAYSDGRISEAEAEALAHEHVAALCGVSRSTVKNAIREARRLGLVTVEERPVTGFRNLPNIVRIVAREWLAWLRLARKHPSPTQGGGVNSATRTHTQVPRSGKTGLADPKKGCRRTAGDLDRGGASRIRAGGGAGRAVR